MEFKNKETGAHTNTVEGMWRHAKMSCPAFNRKKQHFIGYLATFMLRKKWKNEDDSFAEFMKTAAKLYSNGNPPKEGRYIDYEEEYNSIIFDGIDPYYSDSDELHEDDNILPRYSSNTTFPKLKVQITNLY